MPNMTQTPPSRIVSVWFPDLAMDRWRQIIRQHRTLPSDDIPVVLSRDGTHGPVIHATSTAARTRGIEPGARVVDVQAIHPDLHVEPADPAGDRSFLDRLALWARRWSPWTVADRDDGLFLDSQGVAHLFGGEAAMLSDIQRRMAMQGLTAHVAMAATPGAAQALARYGSIQICDDIPAALVPLPTAALRLDDTTVQLLNRLGLKTIGSLAEMPRVSLMRRFSTLPDDRNPLVLLDRAVGRTADPLNAPVDPQQFITRSRLPEPVMDAAPHMADLARQLCQQLAQAEYGARSIRLTIYRIDGEWRQLSLNTARASRDPDHMLRLFRDKLERIDPGFGFDLLTLEALQVEPLSQIQQRLDGRRDSDADLAALLDRLSARLGQDKVSWSRYVQTHKPEAVEHRQPAMAGDPTPPPAPPRERPLRLLTPAEEVQVIYAVPEGPPSQFRWRRVLYKTARHEGPERIAPEWWRDRPGTRLRDYYKVEVQDGRRFWLYREGVVHDGRGDTPRWFLHGLFA